MRVNIGSPVVRTDGRAYGHVITKFSRMGRLPHFLSYGAPSTRALRARVELRYELKVLIFYITSTAYTMSNSRKYAKIILTAIGMARMAPAEVGTGEVTVFEPEKKPEIK